MAADDLNAFQHNAVFAFDVLQERQKREAARQALQSFHNEAGFGKPIAAANPFTTNGAAPRITSPDKVINNLESMANAFKRPTTGGAAAHFGQTGAFKTEPGPKTAREVPDPPKTLPDRTPVGVLEADTRQAEAAYNKNNKNQIDLQLKQELDAAKAAISRAENTAAIDHMRKANALIMTMATPAVDRRWLAEEYKERANAIDSGQQANAIDSVQAANDIGLTAEQHFRLAIQDSALLNQPLLKQASEQLAQMMQRTMVGDRNMIDEFSSMQAKIAGAGSDQKQSLIDMPYQNYKELATLHLERHHFEEAKVALAAAIKIKGWTVEKASTSDSDYARLSNEIAANLPENEKGQIQYVDGSLRTKVEEFGGFIGMAVGVALTKKFVPEASFIYRLLGGTTGALLGGTLMNAALPGERDSIGDVAFNSLLAPGALYGAIGMSKSLAEGFLPGIADRFLGENLTKEKLIQRIAKDLGKNYLNAGELYDFVAGKQIRPEAIGLYRPPVSEADALAKWRATPVLANDQLVYTGADLLAGSKAELNQVARQLIPNGPDGRKVLECIRQAIHEQTLPASINTKEDFLEWAGQHDRSNLAKYKKALEEIGDKTVIFRQGKLVATMDRALPKLDMTKDEVIAWLRSTSRDRQANMIASWTDIDGNSQFIKKGVPVNALRPRLFGFPSSSGRKISIEELTSNKELNLRESNGPSAVTTPDTKITAKDLRDYYVRRGTDPDEVVPDLTKMAQSTPDRVLYDKAWKIQPPQALRLSNAQAAQALSDLQLPKPHGVANRLIASGVGIVRDGATVGGAAIINTIRSGAGMKSIDVLNDAPQVIANGLKWRAAAASPFLGFYAPFAETPVLQRIGKEVTGTARLEEANLTVGQLKAGAAANHIGSKQLLRANLLDQEGMPLTDNSLLIENGKRQPLFVKGNNGVVTPLSEKDPILLTTKAQNATLITAFVKDKHSQSAAQLLEKLAAKKGNAVYTLKDYKADLEALNIDPSRLTKGALINQLPDDTVLVKGKKVQSVATVHDTNFDIKDGFGLTATQRNVVAGSLRPITNTSHVWHKGDKFLNNALNTVCPLEINNRFLSVTANPYIYPELAMPGIKARLNGALSGFNILDATTKNIHEQINFSRFAANFPGVIAAGPAVWSASTYHNAKFDQYGRPMNSGARLTAAIEATGIPALDPATVHGGDQSKWDAIKQAFWKTQDSDRKTWMDAFSKQIDLLYAGQGPVSIRTLDEESGGKLKLEGRIGEKQVFVIDKTRDRLFSLPIPEGPVNEGWWLIQRLWGAFSPTSIVRPGIQSFLINRARPALWVTDFRRDASSLTSDSGVDSLKMAFNANHAIEADYLRLKSGRRRPGVYLRPETITSVPRPNNPGPQPRGLAATIDAQ
jgi:hypothetical protein